MVFMNNRAETLVPSNQLRVGTLVPLEHNDIYKNGTKVPAPREYTKD